MVTFGARFKNFLDFKFISSDILKVFFLGCLNAYCLTPSITNSLGITSLDDGPIQPALAYKYPEYFETDANAVRYLLLMWTSSTKWFPAVAFKYLSIDPVFFHVIFTYMQTILLLIGVFMLSRALTQSRAISFVSVLFVIIYSPYFNNYAWYGDQFFMPYPTWCSVGPILIAWSYAAKTHIQMCIFWLIIGCSIHPAMGICGSVLIATTLFNKYNVNNHRRRISDLVLISCPAIFFSVVSWAIGNYNSASTFPAGWQDLTKSVAHWYAWQWNPNTEEGFFDQSTYSIILIFTAISLLYSFLNQNQSVLNIIVKRSAIVFVVFYVIQSLSYTLNIREVYSLSFGRISIFTSLLAIIIFAKFFTETIQNSSPVNSKYLQITVIIAIIIPSFFNLLVLNLIFLLAEVRNNLHNRIKLLYYFLFSSLILIFLFANYSKSWIKLPRINSLLESLYIVPNFFLIKVAVYFLDSFTWIIYVLLITLFFILMHFIYKFSRSNLINNFFIGMLVLLTVSTFYARYNQSVIRDYEHKEWIAAQVWARDYTAFDSKFILDTKLNLYSSWTTLSNRPRITSASGGFIYTYTKDDEFFDKLATTFGPRPDITATSEEIEQYYLLVSENLGGDYMVRTVKETQLSWREIYKNSKYVIYTVPKL